MRLPYLFSPQWLLWAACTLSIYLSNFFVSFKSNYVGYSWVQIKLLLLLMLPASIHYYLTETDITHMDDFLPGDGGGGGGLLYEFVGGDLPLGPWNP